MGSHKRQRLRSSIVAGHEGYRGGKPVGESRRLLEEVLIEGEGVATHIRKIGCKGSLV